MVKDGQHILTTISLPIFQSNSRHTVFMKILNVIYSCRLK